MAESISGFKGNISEFLNKIMQFLGQTFGKIREFLTGLLEKFRTLPQEKQRMIGAGILGGIAVILFTVALVIGIASCSGSSAQPPETKGLAAAALSSEEEEQTEATPLPEAVAVTETVESVEAVEAAETPEPTAEPVVLKKHDRSPDVLKLQERLIELGYLEIDEPTDYYGSSTEYAVKLFQRQHELEMDGIAGTNTLSLIYSEEAQKYTLREGVEGQDVKMLQEQLADLGYLESSQVDYVYGEITTAAVMAFQKRNKLSVDGKAGEKTLSLLYSDDAKMSAEMEAKVKAEEEAAAKKAKEEEAAQEAKEKDQSEKDRKARKEAEAKAAREKKINKFIKAAQSKLGCEYVLGDRGPDTFDCSGFVYYCLRQAGVSTTRLNAAGYSRKSGWKEITSISDLQKGDILFFRSDSSKAVSHTGIYIGGGNMIDASSGNGKVVRRALSSYWKRNFVNARRPWA